MGSLAKLLKVLNSETDPGQISLACCLGLVIGLTPLWSPHNLLVLLLVLMLRVNLSAFLLSFTLFSGVAYLIDPLFDWIGLSLLTASSLEGLWTSLYNTTTGRLEGFNNSITMGSLVVCLTLFPFLNLLFIRLITAYRERVLEWIRQTRLMKMLQASRFYHAYARVSDWTS